MKRISLSLILFSIFTCGMQVYSAPLLDIPTVEETYNGQILLLRGGNAYDLLGRVVQ